MQVKDEEKSLGDSGERAQNSKNILEKSYKEIKFHSNSNNKATSKLRQPTVSVSGLLHLQKLLHSNCKTVLSLLPVRTKGLFQK